MNKFKKGDIVQLKSGGPKMTVEDERSTGSFICCWFDGNKLQTGNFNPEALVLSDDKQSENAG